MKTTRRHFIGSVSFTAAITPNFISSQIWAANPNDKINLGFIGFGRMNQSHLNFFLNQSDCRVVGVAEVAKVRLDEAIKRVASKYGKNHGCKAYNDFREIISD